jgi:hypothetical protein
MACIVPQISMVLERHSITGMVARKFAGQKSDRQLLGDLVRPLQGRAANASNIF